jgi:hypothetical protein
MAKHLSATERRPSMARRKKRRIGAFSGRLTFSDFDGRTNSGKYVTSIKNALEAQIGDPSPGPMASSCGRDADLQRLPLGLEIYRVRDRVRSVCQVPKHTEHPACKRKPLSPPT